MLGKIYTFHIQYYKTGYQHYIYAILENIQFIMILILGDAQIQCVTLTTRKVVLYLIVQFKRMYILLYVPDIRFKLATFSMLPIIQLLVDDTMYVYQGYIPMSVGNANYQWSYEYPCITSQPDQLVRALDWPQVILYVEILGPKDGSSFTMAGLINRSHQVNSRNPYSPCFSVVCTMKPSENCWTFT